jgi:hypothetical protein
MFDGMLSRYEREDFSVVVKDRGQPPNRWRWEIYRAGRSSAVEHSATLFPTMTAAHQAGKKALLQLFKKSRGSRVAGHDHLELSNEKAEERDFTRNRRLRRL